MTKKDDIPKWVTDEIQSAKFGKPEEITRAGYVLEIYDADNKIDVQIYDAIEDGRHIVTLDVPKKIKISDLLKGVIYEFKFDQLKAPLSQKVVEYLLKEKEIDMNAIYQFELKSLELIDEGSNSTEEDVEE